jgi:hypothetical protein
MQVNPSGMASKSLVLCGFIRSAESDTTSLDISSVYKKAIRPIR